MNSTQYDKSLETRSMLDIRSVDQAEKLVTGIDAKPAEKEKKCYEIVDSIMRNDSEGKEITGSGDAFHNFSVSIIRFCSDYLTAWEIVQLGRKVHPGNVDLLADSLRYGYNCGKKSECKEYYNELKGIDYSRWTSRAFSFAIDYLIYLSTDQGDSLIDQYDTSVDGELKATIKKFQELFPKDDDSRFREYEMYNKRNESENAVAVLVKAMQDLDSCPKCQLRYADMMCDQGKFEEAVDAIMDLCDDPNAVDSVNMAYAYFLRGRIQVAMMNKGQREAREGEGAEAEKKRRSLFPPKAYDADEVAATYDSFRLSLSQDDASERTKEKVISEINTLHAKTGKEIPADLQELMQSAVSSN